MRITDQERANDKNARSYGDQVHVDGPVQKSLAVIKDQDRKQAHDPDSFEFHPVPGNSMRRGKGDLNACEGYDKRNHDADIIPVARTPEEQDPFVLIVRGIIEIASHKKHYY